MHVRELVMTSSKKQTLPGRIAANDLQLATEGVRIPRCQLTYSPVLL